MKIKNIKDDKRLERIAKTINHQLPKNYRVKNKVYVRGDRYVFFIKRKNNTVKKIRSSVIVSDGGDRIILPKYLGR